MVFKFFEKNILHITIIFSVIYYLRVNLWVNMYQEIKYI